jgi:hypothetical protein
LAEARAIAARISATAVASFQRPVDRSGNTARLTADVERLAFSSFDDTDDRRIAGEPACGIERQRRAVLELAPMRLALLCRRLRFREDGLIDVHDHLYTIRRGARSRLIGVMGEELLGDEP